MQPKIRISTRALLSAFVALSLVAMYSPSANAIQWNCIPWLKNLLTKTNESQQAGSPSKVYALLQKRGAFLKQNAEYLSAGVCGGTCASVSYVNNMLVMAETFMPGSISNLRIGQLHALHQDMMSEVLFQLKKLHGQDGTSGASLDQFKDVYPKAYENLFKVQLPEGVSVVDLRGDFLQSFLGGSKIDPGFQSIEPGENTLLVLGVSMGESGHAIVASGFRPRAKPNTLKDPHPESFIAMVSDPHEPNHFVPRAVYEHENKYYLEGYGYGKLAEIVTNGKNYKVDAGEIHGVSAINFRPHQATQVWSESAARALLKPGEMDFHGDVILKNGLHYHDVTVFPKLSDHRLFIYQRFLGQGRIKFEDIAEIRRID